MAQRRSSRYAGPATNPRYRWTEPTAVEVTDIIPFDEFGELPDLDFRDGNAFDTGYRVARAPELDDLDELDDVTPMPLGATSADPDSYADEYDDSFDEAYPYYPEDSPAVQAVRASVRRRGAQHAPTARVRGQHRDPAAGVIKGRLMIVAMAAGAAAAAAHAVANSDRDFSGPAVLSASAAEIARDTVDSADEGVQLITVKAASNPLHSEEFAKAAAYAEERAEREARLQRPLFVMPTRGIPTSGFGYRWGVLHAGIDVANSIGTPIYAVADGVVVDAGPTAGYGMWVKLRHSDGTVTLYGHVNTTLVNIGERVMAGDQIATMGNRGNSTGPHLHFEVMLNGTNRVDPAPWLAERGLSIGGFSG